MGGELAILARLVRDPQLLGGAFRYMGVFRGIVEDVVDPAKRGRVRVRVPAIHGEISANLLPWAERLYPDGGGPYGDFQPLKSSSGPKRYDGDAVMVVFEGFDPSLPIIIGTWRCKQDVIPEVQAATGMARRRIIKTRHGSTLEFGDDRNDFEVKLSMPGGHVVHMRESAGGRGIHITTGGGQTLSLQDENPGDLAPEKLSAYDTAPDKQSLSDQRIVSIDPPRPREANGIAQSPTPGVGTSMGSKGIMLKTATGHSIVLHDNGSGIVITTPGGNTASLQDGTGITLTSPENIDIIAGQNITITAGGLLSEIGANRIESPERPGHWS